MKDFYFHNHANIAALSGSISHMLSTENFGSPVGLVFGNVWVAWLLHRSHKATRRPLSCSTVSSNIMCNEGEPVSPYSPCQSPTALIENSSNHWCQKQHYNRHLCLHINYKYVLLWLNVFKLFLTHWYQRREVALLEHSIPCQWALWGDNSNFTRCNWIVIKTDLSVSVVTM